MMMGHLQSNLNALDSTLDTSPSFNFESGNHRNTFSTILIRTLIFFTLRLHASETSCELHVVSSLDLIFQGHLKSNLHDETGIYNRS